MLAMDSIAPLIAHTVDRYLVIAVLKQVLRSFILARPKPGHEQLDVGASIAPYKASDDQMLMTNLMATATADELDFITQHVGGIELDYPVAPNCCTLRVGFMLEKEDPAHTSCTITMTYQLTGTSVEMVEYHVEVVGGAKASQSPLLPAQITMFVFRYLDDA